MRRSRKAKIAISTLIVIIIGLLLAAAIIIPGVRTLFRVKSSFDSLGPGKCDSGDRIVTVSQYKESIRNYALRQREDNMPNELYSPDDSVRHFKTFFACFKEGVFSDDQINANKRDIVNNVQAAYVSWGEDVCREYCRPGLNNRERADIDEKYADLIEDYYTTFEELQDAIAFRDLVPGRIQYTGPSSCNVNCAG